ncbi:hypothetical protein M8494_19870 [Serratia ureilytica]
MMHCGASSAWCVVGALGPRPRSGRDNQRSGHGVPQEMASSFMIKGQNVMCYGRICLRRASGGSVDAVGKRRTMLAISTSMKRID